MSWFIRRQLKSKSAHVRRQALHQLRGQADEVVVPVIEAVLAVEDQRSVQVAAMEVLGSCPGLAARRLLFSRLGAPDPAVQLAIVEAVGRRGDAAAAARLASLLTSPDPLVRGRTAQVLKQLGWQPATKEEEAAFLVATGDIHRAAFLGAAAVGPLTSILGDTAFQRRVQAVNRLAEIGDPAAVQPLIKALRDRDDVVRAAAADALGQLGDLRAMSVLLPLLKDRNASVRTAAAGALGALGDCMVVDALTPMLQDPHWEVRVATLGSLGRLRDRRATEPVARCLRDSDREVREKAAECLGLLGDSTAIGPLVGALVDEDKFVRQWARLALQQINPQWETAPEAQPPVELLRVAARSHDFGIRYAAEEALRLLGATPQVEASSRSFKPGDALVGLLAEFVGDPDASLRQATVEALARLPDLAARQVFAALRNDPDTSVAMAAGGTLSQRQGPSRAVGL